MPKEQMPDRRTNIRIPYGAWVEDVTEGGLGFFLTQNLSIGGLMLHAKDGIPPRGHKVRLRLVIENERQIVTVKGEVVHQGGPDAQFFGVRFIELEERQRRFLEELIAENTASI